MSISNIKNKIISGFLAAVMSVSLIAPMTSLALSSGTRMSINSSNIVRTVYPDKFDTVTAGSATSVYHIGTGANYGMCARSSHRSPAASSEGTLYQLTTSSGDRNGDSLGSTDFTVTSYQGGGTARLGTFSEYQILMAAARIANDVGSGRSYDPDVYCVLHVYASIILTGDTKYGVIASSYTEDVKIKNKVVTYIKGTATSGHTLYKWVPDNTNYQVLIVRDPVEDSPEYTTTAAPVATTKYVNVDGNYYPGWGCTFTSYSSFSDACNNTNGHEMCQVRNDRNGQPAYWWYDKVTGFGMAEKKPNHDRSTHTVSMYFRETSPATMYYANGQWINCSCQTDDTIYYVTYTWQYEDDNGGGSWMRVQSGYYNSHTVGDYIQTNDKYINTNGSTWGIYGSDAQAAANNIPGWSTTPSDGSVATPGTWTDWLINGQGCGFFGDATNGYWNVVNDLANVSAYVDLTQIKVDTENRPARGAEFYIYSDANCTQWIGTMTDSNNNGHYTFNMKIGDYNPSDANAQVGRTVYIQETRAANQVFINGNWTNLNCRLDTTTYRVDAIYFNSDKTIHYSLSAGGSFIINNNVITATNVSQDAAPDAALGSRVNDFPVTAAGSISLNKVDQNGRSASGAVFTVFSDSTCRTAIGTMTEGTGSNRGSFTFTLNNVDDDAFPGTHYSDETTAVTRTIYIKETSRPIELFYSGSWMPWDFDELDDSIYCLTINWVPANGTVSYSINDAESSVVTTTRTSHTDSSFAIRMGNIENYSSPTYGVLSVIKTGDAFVSASYDENTGIYTPIWDTTTLEGAEFAVYAAEDIIDANGNVIYTENQLVDTITTNAEGIATTTAKLYFNANGEGNYYVVELMAPVGYVLDLTRHDVTLTDDLSSPYTVASTSVSDDHFTPILEVYKNLMPGEVAGTNGEVMDAHDYTQVTFGIYAAEDIYAADGEIIPKDGLIEIVRCDSDGLAISTSNFPFGSYYVRELTTDRWHFMDTTTYGFDYECPASRTETTSVVRIGLTSVVINTPETPRIGTTFTYNNSHVAPMNSTVTLVDTVEYDGLMPHTRYEIEGYNVVVNSDGTYSRLNDELTVVSFETGEANNEDGTVSGSVNVEFVVDTTNLAGKSLVAFESLYHDGVKLAIHMDIHSESQTIVVPNIHTTATVNGVQEFEATADIVLVDTITYENFEVGRSYLVLGNLMDKSTGESLSVGECAADVVATTTFTCTESSGTVTVEFHFNGSALVNGQELVVFEEIYDVETNIKIAEHRDINDQGQTVRVRVTPTPTPTPPTTTTTPPITSTGEVVSETFYVGTILLIGGLASVVVIVLKSRKAVADETED